MFRNRTQTSLDPEFPDCPARSPLGPPDCPARSKDTEVGKTAPVIETYTFAGPNLTPAETWASGVRTPYGMAFSADG